MPFPLVTQIELFNCSCCTPEARPGRHPEPAAAGFSQLSRFWWDGPSQANSREEADSAEPSHSPAAAGHDRAWGGGGRGGASQLTQHQPYLKVSTTKLQFDSFKTFERSCKTPSVSDTSGCQWRSDTETSLMKQCFSFWMHSYSDTSQSG